MNYILIGKPEVKLSVGSVWADNKGKVGLVVGETEQGTLVQTNQEPDVIEIVPREMVSLFAETVTYLGDL